MAPEWRIEFLREGEIKPKFKVQSLFKLNAFDPSLVLLVVKKKETPKFPSHPTLEECTDNSHCPLPLLPRCPNMRISQGIFKQDRPVSVSSKI